MRYILVKLWIVMCNWKIFRILHEILWIIISCISLIIKIYYSFYVYIFSLLRNWYNNFVLFSMKFIGEKRYAQVFTENSCSMKYRKYLFLILERLFLILEILCYLRLINPLELTEWSFGEVSMTLCVAYRITFFLINLSPSHFRTYPIDSRYKWPFSGRISSFTKFDLDSRRLVW